MNTPSRHASRLFLATFLLALGCAAWTPAVPAQASPPATASARSAKSAPGESRAVEPFEAIVLRGGMNLVLRQAAVPGLWVQAGDADPATIDTRVVQRDGRPTLEIEQRQGRGWSRRHTATVTVDWVRLAALTVQGAGDVSADGVATPALKLKLQGAGDVALLRLDTRDLAVSMAGSGDLRATGRAAALAISVAGSGDVDAQALEADTVSISIAGSGDVSVKANQTLSANIAGSGDVHYSGNPQLQTRVAGSGSVTRR